MNTGDIENIASRYILFNAFPVRQQVLGPVQYITNYSLVWVDGVLLFNYLTVSAPMNKLDLMDDLR